MIAPILTPNEANTSTIFETHYCVDGLKFIILTEGILLYICADVNSVMLIINYIIMYYMYYIATCHIHLNRFKPYT